MADKTESAGKADSLDDHAAQVAAAEIEFAYKQRDAAIIEVERLKLEKAELLEWLVKLNKAIDSYWNAPRGLKLTGMGEIFLKEITEAQQQCKIVIARATQQEPKS